MRLARSEVASVLVVGAGDAVCGMEVVVLGAGDDVRLGADVGAASAFVVSESVAWRTSMDAPIAMATIAIVTTTVVTIRTMRLFGFGCGLSLCWIMGPRFLQWLLPLYSSQARIAAGGAPDATLRSVLRAKRADTLTKRGIRRPTGHNPETLHMSGERTRKYIGKRVGTEEKPSASSNALGRGDVHW